MVRRRSISPTQDRRSAATHREAVWLIGLVLSLIENLLERFSRSTTLSRRSLLPFVLLLFVLGMTAEALGQAVFQANAGGGLWNNSGTWTLASGTDADGIPDADDQVTIAGGNLAVTLNGNEACSSLLVQNTGANSTSTRLEIGSYTLAVAGNVTITGGGGNGSKIAQINVGNGILIVSGNLTISAVKGSELNLNLGTSTLNISGSMTGGTNAVLNAGTASTVNLNGTSAQTLNLVDFIFANVTLNNSAGVTANAAITATNITGDLRVETGTFASGGFAIAGNGAKTFEVAGNASFITTTVNPSAFPTGFSISLNANSTVDYAGLTGTTQTVSDQTYGNLKLSGGGTKSAGSAISVAGTLTQTEATTTATLSGTTGHDLTVGKFDLQAGSFNDNGRTITVTGTGSAVWTKAGTFNPTGTTIFTGAAPQIGASNFAALQINVGSGNSALANGILTVTNFALLSGTFNPGLFAHTISTNFSLGSGSTLLVRTALFTGNYSKNPTSVANGSTVDYQGTNSSLANFTHSNLIVSGSITGSSNATVDGAFTVTGSFTPSVGAVRLGNSTIVNSGTLQFRGLELTAGAFVQSSSNFLIDSAMTLLSGASFSPTGTITLNNGVTLANAGTMIFHNLTLNSGALIANTDYSVNGTLSGAGTFNATAGTVTFGNLSSLTISGLSFQNLTFSGAVTANVDMTVKGTLTIGGAGVFNPSSGTVTIPAGGSIVNSGSLSFNNLNTSGTGSVTMNTSFTLKNSFTNMSTITINQTSGVLTTISGASINNSGSLTLSNVTIGGTTTANGTVTVNGAVTLNGNLTVSGGALIMGSSATTNGTFDIIGGVRRGGFIIGTTYSFGNPFTTLTFDTGGTLPDSITYTIQIGSAPVEKTDAVQRSYSIAILNGSGYSASFHLHYRHGELNGNSESAMYLYRKNGSVYQPAGRSAFNTTDDWIGLNNVSTIAGDWAIANKPAHIFTASNDGAWNNPATWGLSGTPSEGETYPGPVDSAYIGNDFEVALTGNHSAYFVSVNAPGNSGTTLLDIGTFSLSIGGTGLNIEGNDADDRIARVRVAGGTLSVSDNIRFIASTDARVVLDISSGASTLNIGRAMVKNTAGTFSPGISSTVVFNGSSAQSINLSGFTYANVTVNNNAGISLLGNVTSANIAGNLRVVGGTLNNNGYSINGDPLKTFEVANGATFILGSTSAFPTGFGTVSLGATSTVNYNGTNQTISEELYGNLTLGGSGSKTIQSPLAIQRTLHQTGTTTSSLSSTSGYDIIVGKVLIDGGTFIDNGRTIEVTGTGSGTWTKTGGTYTANGTTVFSGSAPEIGASNFSTLQIYVGSGNVATAVGALTPNTLTLTSGTFDPGLYTHTVSSNLSIEGGSKLLVRSALYSGNYSLIPTMIQSGSTIEYTATGATVAAVSPEQYENLTISGTVTGASTATVNSTFLVSGTFTPSGGTITFGNGSSLSGTGTTQFSSLSIANSATVTASNVFSVGGTLSVGSGASFSPSNTVTLNSATIVNSGTLTFQNVSLIGTVTANTSFTLSGSMSGAGTLNATSGTITFGNGSSLATSGSVSFNNLTINGTVVANTSFGVKGTLSVNAGGVLNPTSGTVTLSNGSSISNSGTLSFKNLSSSGTVNINSNFTLKGTFTNTGTINQTSGIFSTAAGAVMNNSGTLSLNNLTIGGATTLNDNATVSGTLTLDANLTVVGDSLTMSSSAVTGGTADVIGRIRRTPFTTGTAYTFGNQYTTITFNSATVLPSSIVVKAAIGSSPIEKSDAVHRYYEITETGGSGFNATLRLHYLDSELNSNSEGILSLWKKSGTTYVEEGNISRDQTANWIEQSAVDTLTTTWTLAVETPTGFTAATDGFWDAPATWGLTGTPQEGVNYPGVNDNVNISNNYTVTLRANQSAKKIILVSAGANGTSTLAVGSYTLTVGTGGIELRGGRQNGRKVLITVGGGILNIAGNIFIDAKSIAQAQIDLTGGVGSRINITGDISRNDDNDGALTFNSTGIINFNGTSGGQTLDVTGSIYANIYLNNTSSAGVVLDGAITTVNVIGDIRLQSGTFNTNGFANAGNTGKTFELTNGTTLYLSGVSTFPTGFTPSIGSTSTINYSGGAQTISDQAYGHLTLSGTGAKTINSSISVTGNFTYSATATTSLSATAGQNLTASMFTLSAGTFIDSGRTITVTGTGGQVWTKTGGTFTATGIVNITGAAAQIGSSNFATLSINVGIGNTALANGALSTATFTLTTGAFDPGTHTHTISGSFTVGDGTTLLVRTTTFPGNYSSNPTTQPGSIIEYTNAAASISNAFTYRNLKISGNVTGAASATVIEQFIVSGSFTPATGKMIFNNGASIVNSGAVTFRKLQISNSATVTTASSFSITDSLIVGQNAIFQPSGTVSFVTSGSIDVNPTLLNEGILTFNNLSISAPVHTSSSFTIGGTLDILVNGELNPTGGTTTMTGGSSIVNSWILSFYKLRITGSVTANTNFSVKDSLIVSASGTLQQTSGTVTLENGAKVGNSGSLTFYTLSIAGAVSANTSFSIASSLSVTSSGNLTSTAGTVTMNSGTSISNLGTLNLNNLTIAGGTITGNNNFSMQGVLQLDGNLAMGSNTFEFGSTATSGGTGDVTGRVKRAHVFTASTAYAFGSQYTTVTFTSLTSAPGSITINIIKGSTPPEKVDAIQRYYDITSSGGTYAATLRLRYLTGELNGNDASTLSLWAKVGVSSYADSGKTTNDLVNNWVEDAGITSIVGTWTLSRQNPIGFTAVATGNWNDPATWGRSGIPTEGVNYPGPSDSANIINNVTVTLTGNHSAKNLRVEAPTLDGTSRLDVGAYTLNVGSSGLKIAGGTSDARIATVTIASGKISVLGDVTLQGSSAVRSVLDMSLGANSILEVGGSLSKSGSPTFTPGSSGIVNFNGTTAGQIVNVTSFVYTNLRLNNTSGSGVTLSAAITGTNVTGDVRVQSGIFTNSGYAITGNSGKTFEVANGASFYLTGSSAFPTGFGSISLGSTSTVNYSGGSQSISNQSYGNLTLSGTGNHNITSSLSAAGTLTYSSSGATSLSGTAGHNVTAAKFNQTSGTFNVNSRTITITGTGASTWSKTGGTFAATGEVIFTGSAPEIGASNFDLLRINLASGGVATATGILSATNFYLTSGTFDPGTSLHTITTNFTLAAGTTMKVKTSTFGGNYSKAPTTITTGSTIEYTNTTSTLATLTSPTYSNLKVSGTVTGSSIASINDTLIVSGTVINPGGTITLNNGGRIRVDGGSLTFTNLTTAASATAGSASNFAVAGTLTVGAASTASFTGTVTMNGGSIISNTSGALTFGTLSISGTVTANTNYTISTALSVGLSGVLSPTSGTVIFSNTSSITNQGVLELYDATFSGITSTSSNFSVKNAFSVSASSSFAASGGTVSMLSSSSITNSGTLTFSGLRIDAGTVTSSSSFSISGLLTVASGATFNPAAPCTITMNNGASITRDGTSTFTNLAIAAGTVTGNTNLAVSGTLTLNGTLAMGSNILDLTAATAAIAGTGDVTGNVRRQHAFASSTSYAFGNQFTTLNFASGTLPTSITFTIALGTAPAEKTDAIQRKYSVSVTGGSGYSATLRLHYLDTELNGNTSSTLTLWNKSGASYADQGRTGSVDETNKWVEKASLTSLIGDWTLANQPSVGFTATVTGNWNTPATWSLTGSPQEGVNYPGPTDIVNVNGGFTVTLTANHSAQRVNITGTIAGAAIINVGANTLSVGSGGITLTGGSTDARYACINVDGGTLNVTGNIVYSTGIAARAVVNLGGVGGSAASTMNLGGVMSKSTAGTFTPGSASVVNYNSSALNQTVDVINFTYANLHINNMNASGASLNAAVTAVNVTGNLRVQSGQFSNSGFGIAGNPTMTLEVAAGATLKLTGTSTFPTGFGTISLNAASTVEYNGGAQTVTNQSYGNLILSGNGSKTIASALNVGGRFTYNSSAATSLAAGGLTTSKFTLASGTFSANSAKITVTGTGDSVWIKSGGTFTATGKVSFIGALPQIYSSNFDTLEIAVGASGRAVASGILSSSQMFLTTGTYDPGVFGHTIVNNFILSNGTTLLVRGAEFVTNYSKVPTNVGASSAVEYSSSAIQTINSTFTYGKLRLEGGGSNAKSAGGALTVLDSTIISSGSTFNGVSYNHRIRGTWRNEGTYVSSTGTITLNGTAAQTIAGTSATSFNNLVMNNTAGLTISTSPTVIGTLTFTSGTINTGSNKITIAASGVVSRTSGHVVGNFEKYIAAGATTRTFEIGDATNYTPAQIAFSSVSTGGYLTARTDPGDHADIANSGIDPALSINRTWTVTNNGISFTTYGATFTFVPGDLDGGVVTGDIVLAKLDGITWTSPTMGTVTATTMQATGITGFSKFQGGNPSVADFTSITTGNWNSASTWDKNRVPKKNDRVTIAASHTVTLTDAREITNLSVAATGEFAIGTNTLTVWGNIILNGTWSGSGMIDWRNNGTSLGGTGTTSGTPMLQANGDKSIDVSATLTLFRIDIPAANAVTNNGAIQLTRLTGGVAGSTWINAAGSSLSVIQDLLTTGTLTTLGVGNTLTYSGNTAQTVKAITYQNIAFSGSGTKTLSADLTVQGDFINSSTVSVGTHSLSISGTRTNSGTVQFAGAANGVLFTDGTVEYNGTSVTQTIASGIYNNLTLSGSVGKTAGGDVTVNGNFNNSVTTSVGNSLLVISGTKTNSGTMQFAGASNGILFADGTVEYNGTTLAQTITIGTYNNLTLSGTTSKAIPAGTLGIAGIFTVSGVSVDATSNNSTIDYFGNGAQSIAAIAYHHLTLRNSGTKTFSSGTTYIGGNLTISAPAAANATTNSSTIEYNGTTSQSIAGMTYHLLNFSGSGLKTLSATMTVNSHLTVNAGASVLVTNTGLINLQGDLLNDGYFRNDGTIIPF
ncbi:MAG: hypothetical protein V1799_13675 [bacterium]